VVVVGRSLPLSLSEDPFKIPDLSLFFVGNEPSVVGSIPPESADSKDAVLSSSRHPARGILAKALEGDRWGGNRPARAEEDSCPLKLARKSDPNGRKEVIDC
jgi:hypothetical protein